jgi:hypothetical protein
VFHHAKNVLLLKLAGLVAVFVNISESKELNQSKRYILADEGVWSLQARVVKLEQTVLSQLVQLFKLMF